LPEYHAHSHFSFVSSGGERRRREEKNGRRRREGRGVMEKNRRGVLCPKVREDEGKPS
jgi:hypothetical protein